MRPILRKFRKSLPNHTTILLRNTSSPQFTSWDWLISIDDNLNLELWKLQQRFALACFRFATNAFAAHIVDDYSPLDLDECQWSGIVCNQGGNVTRLALPYSGLTGSVPRELYFFG